MSYYDQLSALGIKLTKRYGQEKVSCPKCYDGRKNKNKKDLSVNITTGDYCCHNDGCDFKGNVRVKENKEQKHFILPAQDSHIKQSLSKDAIKWFGQRMISKPTLDRYMVYGKKNFIPQTGKDESCVCFPYFKNAKLVNIKFRDGRKNFCMVKDAELSLFGLQFLRGRKYMIIVEGEIDCLTLAECGYGHDEGDLKKNIDTETGEVNVVEITKQKSKWCPVSVPNGASEKGHMLLEYLDNCFEELIDIHEFIIAVDDDVAGRRLKDELIRRLGVERCRFIVYPRDEVVELQNNLTRPCKDLNEVHKYLGAQAVVNCIDNAQFIPIEGVYYLPDLYPKMLEKFKRGLILGETTRMGADMDMHFRWKRGDVNVGIGYGNWGKTYFENQLELCKSIYDDWKWAVFCPENFPADDFYDDLAEPFIGKSLDKFTDEEYEFACRFIGDHFFYVYPEEDHDLTSIFERFRNLIMKKGIDGVRIDPYNQLDREHGQWGMTVEERLSVDLKKCKRFALHNQIVFNIIAHPKNPDYINKETKQLPIVDMYDVSGGAQWGNKPDTLWSLYRPNWHVNKEDSSIDVIFQKIKRKRTGGKLGTVHMMLNNQTKRYQMMNSQEPCDPRMAEKIKRAETYQQGISTPLFNEDLDSSDEDLPF
jgi:twinkle protein